MSNQDLDDPFLCEPQPEDREALLGEAPEKPEWTDEQLQAFSQQREQEIEQMFQSMLKDAPW